MKTNGQPPNIETLLDEAWDALDSGDLEQAAEALDRAGRIDDGAAEVLLLQGALHEARGELQEALHAYERSARVDEQFLPPLVYAADLLVDRLAAPEAALRMCDRAAPLAEDSEAQCEVAVLRACALLDLHRPEEALDAVRKASKLGVNAPDLMFRLGTLWLDLGETDHAIDTLRATVEKVPDHADAYHALGLAYEQNDDQAAMATAWLKTLELDALEELPSWHLSRSAFDAVVEQAMALLPDAAKEKLRNVPVLVDDAPCGELVREGLDPRVLGLFAGPALTEQGVLDAPSVEPAAITLFQRNLERACLEPDQLVEEVRITVLHETAHYFGLEEDELQVMGLS
ncbi:MAG: metallopeptidase family protein [Polyangiaceae bacterium]|jgi:predicted Zn-dependent protease with MMP-like domain|nr:metallopeptidase family protein [Polyangiaceae bacterium]